jgi:hypothetical protein
LSLKESAVAVGDSGTAARLATLTLRYAQGQAVRSTVSRASGTASWWLSAEVVLCSQHFPVPKGQRRIGQNRVIIYLATPPRISCCDPLRHFCLALE